MILSLLTGCGNKTFSCQGLHIKLPGSFQDYSDADQAKNFAFLYLSQDLGIGISGTRTNKMNLTNYKVDMSLEEFAEFLTIQSNLDVDVVEKNGIWHFIYSLDTGNGNYTYLAAVFQDNLSFWSLQCYSKTDHFPKVQEQMWEYLRSVSID